MVCPCGYPRRRRYVAGCCHAGSAFPLEGSGRGCRRAGVGATQPASPRQRYAVFLVIPTRRHASTVPRSPWSSCQDQVPGRGVSRLARDPLVGGSGAERLEVVAGGHLRGAGWQGDAGTGEDVEAEVAASLADRIAHRSSNVVQVSECRRARDPQCAALSVTVRTTAWPSWTVCRARRVAVPPPAHISAPDRLAVPSRS